MQNAGASHPACLHHIFHTESLTTTAATMRVLSPRRTPSAPRAFLFSSYGKATSTPHLPPMPHTVPPRTHRLWQSNLDTLTSQLGLQLASARALVRTHPALLSSDPQGLLGACARLKEAAGGADAPLLQALDGLPAVQLYACLRYGPQQLQHLEYLAEMDEEMQAEAAVAATASAGARSVEEEATRPSWKQLSSPYSCKVMVPREAFAAAHPGFAGWLLKRRSREHREQRRLER